MAGPDQDPLVQVERKLGMGLCPTGAPVQPAQAASTGTELLWWGFVQDPAVTQVQVQIADGTTEQATVSNGVYYVTRAVSAWPPPPVPQVRGVTGYDAAGNQVFQWPWPAHA